MSITSGNLITINNTAIPGLKEYKIGFNKLWKDAERNMNGDVRASAIGVFPKIELVFRDALTAAQIRTITQLLNQPYFSVTYLNPQTNANVTAQYYAGDYTVDILERSRGLYKSFSVNLVPVSKMA